MRARFLSFLLCFLFFVSCAGIAVASPARETLEHSLTDVLNVLKNPDYANPEKRPALRKKIEGIVHNAFDFLEFSSRTVGQNWARFTPEQKNAFAEAFSDLLINTYLNKIDGYNGEQVSYGSEKISPKGDRADLATIVIVCFQRITPGRCMTC